MTVRLRLGVLGLSHDHVWRNLAAVARGEIGRLVHQPRATRDGQTVGPGRVQIARDAGNETVEPPPLPSAERDGPSYFLTCVRAGRPVEGLCAPDVGRDVQEVLAAALQASATGRDVRLPAGAGLAS